MIVNEENNVIVLIILMSSIIWLSVYALISYVEKNHIHFLTLSLFTFFPTCYFFEFVYVANANAALNAFAYGYYFSIYTVAFVSIALGYLFSKNGRYVLFKKKALPDPAYSSGISTVYFMSGAFFAVIAFLLYMPILVEFKDYLLNPRRIYELTRTGYGLSFFLSNTLSLVSVLFCIYAYARWKLSSVLVIAFNFVLILLHGSKTPILISIFMMLLYSSVIKGKKYNVIYVFGVVALVSALMFCFFLITYNITPNQVFLAMAGYSDYTRNAIILFESNYSPQLGRLLFESEVYSRIPRAIFPWKPDDFGYLELAKHFFPDLFYLNQGAPSFGLGVYYADFGFFAHIVVCVAYFFKGALAGLFRNQLHYDARIHFFIPYLFMSGVALLNLGMGWMFFEHIVLSLIIWVSVIFTARIFNVRY